jgi:4'-phosphopantetheinyl transferase
MHRLHGFYREHIVSAASPVLASMPGPSSSIVSIWHAANSSGDPGLVESRCESWLDGPDRERAALFKRPTTRNQHVIGRGMSRRLLSTPDVQPQSIQFGVEDHGKPVVTGPPEVQRPFNVTHTDGLVMCCIGDSNHHAVGIDVERFSRRTNASLADRNFSKPEIDFLNRCRSEESKKKMFLRIWTLKESFIKAIGTGLSMPLTDFAFEHIDSNCPTIRMLNPDLESDLHWRFYAMEPRPGFTAALAVAIDDMDATVDYELAGFESLVE